MNATINHKVRRHEDTSLILNSAHPRRVVVAGPGTGKSFLFQEAIKTAKEEGKRKFLALTFMGKLCDELADDLAGLATTKTLHGFAREFVLSQLGKNWIYLPNIKEIIAADLLFTGINNFEIGDKNYRERTKYYKTVGHDDVLFYAVELCRKNNKIIPIFDMVLVDEYQDLNEKEAEFIDLLGKKNKLLVVGDDDQALYEFKGSFSKYIRSKHSKADSDFESHTLRYCSRCTDVIINTFHDIVKNSNLPLIEKERINKEYISYPPDKQSDSNDNPDILVMEEVSDGLLAYKVRSELEQIIETQKIKSVLVVGEGQSCQTTLSMVARLLSEMGFLNVEHKDLNKDVYEFNDLLKHAYRLIGKDENHILGWRLVIEGLKNDIKRALVKDNFNDATSFTNSINKDLHDLTIKNSKVLRRIETKPKSNRDTIAPSSLDKLSTSLVLDKKKDNEILLHELMNKAKNLPRPLKNLDIVVCSILGSKGLGADVVFLVGFDNKRLPVDKKDIKKSEIYQMLVALTRAKKRIYLVNSSGREMSKFIELINKERYKVI